MIQQIEHKPNFWVLKSILDIDRSFQTIESYKDRIGETYNYDSKVANSQQIKTNDYAIIINKKKILGLGKIQTILINKGTKIIIKCPECGSSTIDTRKTLKPTYRCNKGHSFNTPESKKIAVNLYSAIYNNSYLDLQNSTNVSLIDIRPYYTNGYNQNMSMQRLDNSIIGLFQEAIGFFKIGTGDRVNLTAEAADEKPEDSYTNNNTDERASINRQIKERRGQKKFREDLRKRYGSRCIITECTILDILEAAHIAPYRGPNDNNPSNGLLLRADIHTLFDLNLIGIEPSTFKIHLSDAIKLSEYQYLQNKELNISAKKPSNDSIKNRWEQFQNLTNAKQKK